MDQNEECEEFQQVWNDSQQKRYFKAFCVDSKKQEIFLFLDALEEFDLFPQGYDKYTAAKKILESYFRQGAATEINVSSETRDNILGRFELECSKSFLPPDLFSFARDYMILQLKNEAFPLFVKSKYYKYMQQKKNAEMITQMLGDHLPTFSRHLSMKSNFIVDDDFKRIVEMAVANENTWVSVGKFEQGETFLSKKSMVLESQKGIKAFKYVQHLPYPARDILNAITCINMRLKVESSLSQSKLVEYIKHDVKYPYAMVVNLETMKMPWPLTTREFLFCTSVRYEQRDKRYVIARKTITHANVPPKKEHIRGDSYSGTVIQETGPSSCTRTVVAVMTLNGMSPTVLLNEGVKSKGKKDYESLMKAINESGDISKPPEDTQGFLDTLVENTKILLEEQQAKWDHVEMGISPLLRRNSSFGFSSSPRSYDHNSNSPRPLDASDLF